MKSLAARCDTMNVLPLESILFLEVPNCSLADRSLLLRNWFNLGCFHWLMATIGF